MTSSAQTTKTMPTTTSPPKWIHYINCRISSLLLDKTTINIPSQNDNTQYQDLIPANVIVDTTDGKISHISFQNVISRDNHTETEEEEDGDDEKKIDDEEQAIHQLLKRCVEEEGEDSVEVINCDGHILSPGFIDLQLNGAFGIDFSNPNITQQDIQQTVSNRLPCHGVTSFCPTLISCSYDTYCKIIPIIGPLCQCYNDDDDDINDKKEKVKSNGANILGMHLEGPFFAKSKRGAHSESCIRDPGTKDYRSTMEETYGISSSCSLKGNNGIAIVTLAPERCGALNVIKGLSDSGVVVAMGHTDATLKEGVEGVKSGAMLLTHLFNAMKPFHHREPGLVGLLMYEDDADENDDDDDDKTTCTITPEHRPYFSLIVDGIHSHPSAVKLAHRLHPEGAVLITDAMSAMGLGDGTHTLGTMNVDISGNRATVSGTDTLAGSVASMDSCVKSYRKFTRCSVGEALRAATLHPAKVLSIDEKKGKLSAGYDADLILLDDELNVMATWVNGKKVFDNFSAVGEGGKKRKMGCS